MLYKFFRIIFWIAILVILSFIVFQVMFGVKNDVILSPAQKTFSFERQKTSSFERQKTSSFERQKTSSFERQKEPRAVCQKIPPIVFRVPTKEPEVLLTFDDGPSPKYTKRILNTLKKYGIRAIFFVVGERAQRHPKLIQKIVEENHILGNHTWDHANYARLSAKEQYNDMKKACKVLQNFQKICFFRSAHGIHSDQIRTSAHQQGMKFMLWSIDALDWKKPRKTQMIAQITAKLKPGAIILLHDIQKVTADALEDLILAIQKKGYRFYNPHLLLDQAH